MPSKKDLGGLYRAVRDPLGISPEKSDIPPAIVDDVRKVLSGLVTCVEGIGALRTHAGDAYGRERGYRRIDPRIARLLVHAASTIALFIMDTWQQKFPTKHLSGIRLHGGVVARDANRSVFAIVTDGRSQTTAAPHLAGC